MQRPGSLAHVDRADLYVGIFAHRYGYIEQGYGGRSVTECEFDYAGERAIDRLCFLLNPVHLWPPEYRDEDYENQRKFRDKVENELVRKHFTTVDNFKAGLVQSLATWQRNREFRGRADLEATLVQQPDDLATHLPSVGLIGRDALLADIKRALDRGKRVLLQGSGGMGKTALAATYATQAVNNSGGPALWLRAGNSDAQGVFVGLARPFGHDKAVMQHSGDAQVAEARRILAGCGAKLVVLDDVWNGPALLTVLKAIPQDMGVIITARQRYPTLQRLTVDRLERSDAVRLLGEYGGADYCDDAAADALCKQLGDSAFALRVAGITLEVDEISPAELRQRIQDAPHDMKMPVDFAEEGRASIKQLLDASLEALDDGPRAVFLTLGAFFGTQITPELVRDYYVLGDGDGLDIDNGLTVLVRRGLLERVAGDDLNVAYYRLHDLALTYATAQNTLPNRHRALDAVLGYMARYNAPSLSNFAALRPLVDHLVEAQAFAESVERWIDVEQFAWNLYYNEDEFRLLDYQGLYMAALAILERAFHAATQRADYKSTSIYVGNSGIVYRRLGQYEKAIERHQHALRICRDINHERGIGAWLGNLGSDYRNLGKYEEAIAYYQEALPHSRTSGDEYGVSAWLGNLGRIYTILGQYDKAIGYHQDALVIAGNIKDRRGEGDHLGNLGRVYTALGQYDNAIAHYQQALDIAREIGDRRGEGHRLGNLGQAYHNLGQYEQAIDQYQAALDIAGEIGDRRSEGRWLGSLGLTYKNLGQYGQAIEYYQQALVISRDIGDKRAEGAHLGNLGLAYRNMGQYQEAIEQQQQALLIARDIGDRRSEGNHLGSLALAYANLKQYDQAIEHYQQALVISRDISDRRGEGIHLGNLGLAYAGLDQDERAIEQFQAALKIAHKIGDRRSEGIWLHNLGLAYANLGQYEQAIGQYQTALKLAREIGDRRGEGVRLHSLGITYRDLKEYNRALEYLQKSLVLYQALGVPHLIEEAVREITETEAERDAGA